MTIKRTKEEGLAFLEEQLMDAEKKGDKHMTDRLKSILKKLKGDVKNGLRIQPDRVRKKDKS